MGRRVQVLALEIAAVAASTWLLALACSTLGGSGGGDSDSKPKTDPGGCHDCGDDPPGVGGGSAGEADSGLDAEPDADAAPSDASAEAQTNSPNCTPETDSGITPLIRPGCPTEKPVASRCGIEGVRCLYPSEGDADCFEEWTCLFGIWSPLEDACRRGPGVDENSAACPGAGPVEGEPCDSEGLECGYEQCWNEEPTFRTTCACGRTRIEAARLSVSRSEMKAGLFALLALLGCTEITKTDWNPPDNDVPEPGSGGSPAFGSGGFGADSPVPEVGVVGGYGIDATQGGQIIGLQVGPTQVVLANADGSTVLAGGAGMGLPSGGNIVTPVLLVLRLTSGGFQESSAYAYAGENSTAKFGGATVDDQGNVYVVGSYRGSLTLNGVTLTSTVNPGIVNVADPLDTHGKASQDAFIFKLDRWGGVLWVLNFGGIADQAITAIALGPDGSLVLPGAFTGELWFGPQTLLSSGGSTVPDLVVMRISADAVPLSVRQFAGDVPSFSAVGVDAEGNVLLGGTTSLAGRAPILIGHEGLAFGHGGYVLKLDSSFEPLWLTNLGENQGPELQSLSVDPQGNVVVPGHGSDGFDLFGETPEIGTGGVVLAKLDPDGAPIFGKTYGNTTQDFASSATLLSDDTIAFTGTFYRDVDFGAGRLLSLEPRRCRCLRRAGRSGG